MSHYIENFNDNLGDLSIRVPIPSAARQQAELFATAQPTQEKRSQVYRNTLAVWLVNDYLQRQQYETDLLAGDSWQFGTQLCGDVADLVVTGLGRIECRPLVGKEARLVLPPETWHNRIAYVGVSLDKAYREGQILGFISVMDPEDPLADVLLGELRSVGEWMDYFHRLEVGQQTVANFFQGEGGQFGASDVLDWVEQIWDSPAARELLVAQLERIVCKERPSRWRVKGEKVMSGRLLAAAVRETEIEVDRLQVQELAGALLSALVNVWGE